jgi:hypothetical protein
MDRFATPSECWQQAALCRAGADAAADKRLRAVWMSMALIWTKLAAHKERFPRLNAEGDVSDTATETQVTTGSPCA